MRFLDLRDGAILLAQSEDVASSRCGRQLHDTEASELLAAVLLFLDCDEQVLERGLQLRLVVNEQRILPEEPGVEGLGFESETVATEQEAAADHVHRPEDDGRA